MDTVYTGEQILEITGGRLAAGLLPLEAGHICTDTRLIQEGDWFLALPGAVFDGHDFIGDAFAGGAIGCIVSERPGYAISSPHFAIIAVDNTMDAFAKLGRE